MDPLLSLRAFTRNRRERLILDGRGEPSGLTHKLIDRSQKSSIGPRVTHDHIIIKYEACAKLPSRAPTYLTRGLCTVIKKSEFEMRYHILLLLLLLYIKKKTNFKCNDLVT